MKHTHSHTHSTTLHANSIIQSEKPQTPQATTPSECYGSHSSTRSLHLHHHHQIYFIFFIPNITSTNRSITPSPEPKQPHHHILTKQQSMSKIPTPNQNLAPLPLL